MTDNRVLIERMDYSAKLYVILKRKGVDFVHDIPRKIDFTKLTKPLLLELLEKHGKFIY